MISNLLADNWWTDTNSAGTIQVNNPALGAKYANVSGVTFLGKLLPAGIVIGLTIGVIIFFFIFLMGAIQWISSGGDKQGLEEARGKLTNALVGLIILFATFAIIKAIEAFFGINILSLDIGPLIIR